jgi:hypothetical protein
LDQRLSQPVDPPRRRSGSVRPFADVRSVAQSLCEGSIDRGLDWLALTSILRERKIETCLLVHLLSSLLRGRPARQGRSALRFSRGRGTLRPSTGRSALCTFGRTERRDTSAQQPTARYGPRAQVTRSDAQLLLHATAAMMSWADSRSSRAGGFPQRHCVCFCSTLVLRPRDRPQREARYVSWMARKTLLNFENLRLQSVVNFC